MSEILTHRGPDGMGDFHTPHLALGMRRLSIIDTQAGWQPLFNEDRSLVVVANGEIYNYLELRRDLTARGHQFRTGSDIEVIPHLYQEHGDSCVQHLRGMFAFALWDNHRQRLILARDRMGEKPLYLYQEGDTLTFGSEIKALLRSGIAPFALDAKSVDLFFHYQYVPEPSTPIRGVRKLPAGHLLAATLDPWSIEEACYWRMEDAPPLEGDPARTIRAELDTISEIVIRSDVPVGIALSGGLDSSAIAVLAAGKYPGVMNAFSVGYPERPQTDEREDARALANHLGMPFHEVEVETSEVVASFPQLVAQQDDPIADISGYGYFAIARAARRQEVPVLLQGQGGDELFWGYAWVREALRQTRRKSRLGGHPSIMEYLRLTRPRSWPRRAPMDWLLSLAGLRSSWEDYRRDRSTPPEQLVFYDLAPDFADAGRSVGGIYTRRFQDCLGGSRASDLFTVPLPWPQLEVLFTRLIIQTYLAENGIAQGDRLGMASSVELRLPLVDYRLVETVIGLRKAHSDAGLAPKSWFRQAVEDVVPPWVLHRRKRGFQPPIRAWHRAIFAEHGRLLRDGALVELGVLEPVAARQLSKGGFPLTATAPLSFKALVLELWCRQYHKPQAGSLN